MQPVVFVVPGEAGAAGHKRVVAVADRVGRDIAEVGCRGIKRTRPVSLLRHPDCLVPTDEYQLRAIDVVRFEQDAIPRGILRPRGQDGAGNVVIGDCPPDEVAVTLAKPSVILAVLSHNGKIDMLTKIELANEAFPAERFVAGAGARKRPGRSTTREPRSRRFSDHGVEAHALHAELSCVKSLAGGKESGIGVAVNQARGSVAGTQ